MGLNFDNLIPADVQNQLSDEQLVTLMENIKASALRAARGNTADQHTFGESIYNVISGEKGTTIAVTRKPLKGKRVKGTYLTTLYRATQIKELFAANPDAPYFAWLNGFVELEIEADRLELL